MDLEFEQRRMETLFEIQYVERAFHNIDRSSPAILIHKFVGESNNLEFEWCPELNQLTIFSPSDGIELVFNGNGEVREGTIASALDWSIPAKMMFKLGYAEPFIGQSHRYTVSAHEKLVCRDELPREFWPASWSIESDGVA